MKRLVMIIAGEASGDRYGAELTRELKKMDSTIRIIGFGGVEMKGEGVDVIRDLTRLSVVGIGGALKNISFFYNAYRELKSCIRWRRPNALVLIDFAEFNFRVAHFARKLGIPTIYYFPPAAWAWRGGRARKLAQLVNLVVCALPFEAKFYEENGAKVKFVGHPLLDLASPKFSREEAILKFKLSTQGKLIGLLPGSRKGELRLLLPILLKTAAEIKKKFPHAQFILPLAKTLNFQDIKEEIKRVNFQIRIVKNEVYDVMNVCDALVVASGTAALEAACIGTPLVVVYRLKPLAWMVAKFLVKTKYISLPNIIAQREVVPEFLQDMATPKLISDEVISLLSDPNRVEKMKAELQDVKSKLGEKGASRRVAEAVLELVK